MALISVSATPNAHEERVERIAPGEYAVWVTAVAEKGKANVAVIRALARHFGIAPSCVRLVRGAASSKKLFEIPDGVPV